MPKEIIDMNNQVTCTSCGARPAVRGLYVACGAEYRRQGDGTPASSATWEKADVWKHPFRLCDSCIPAISERCLQAELKSSKRGILQAFGALAFFVFAMFLAELGAFRGGGSFNLFLAIGLFVAFLYWVIGIPLFVFRTINQYAQLTSLRRGEGPSEKTLKSAVKLDSNRLLKQGELKWPSSHSSDVSPSLPDGLPHRETVLASGEDDEELLAGCPEEWKPWFKRRI